VIGGGLVGLTSAYYLRQTGLAVSVLDRRPGVSLECSYANAAFLSPRSMFPVTSIWEQSHPSEAWARFSSHFPSDPDFHKLAQYQLELNELGIELLDSDFLAKNPTLKEKFVTTDGGYLALHLNEDGVDEMYKKLRQHGRDSHFSLLDRNACLELDSSLKNAGPFEFGVWMKRERTGDAFIFSGLMEEWLKSQGVEFHFGESVDEFQVSESLIESITTSAGKTFQADVFVAACGSFIPQLLEPLRKYVPVYPLQGHSITIKVPEGLPFPGRSLSYPMQSYTAIMSPLPGRRLRVTGFDDVAGFEMGPGAVRPERIREILTAVFTVFPEIIPANESVDSLADWIRVDDYMVPGTKDPVKAWVGLRPQSPDSLPIVGYLPGFDNLMLNAGHGKIGWMSCCATAKMAASLITGNSGLESPYDIHILSPTRFSATCDLVEA